MAYIGKEPIVGNFQVCDAISVVNGQAAYTMQVSSTNVVPESANHMLVSLNGILQKPNSSFTVSGSTITFASNLATGDVIDFIMLLGNVLDIGTPSDSTVTNAKTNFTTTSSAAGLQIKGDGTTAGALQLNCEQNSHGIQLQSPPHSANQSYTIKFPSGNITAGKFLKVDSVSGSGTTGIGTMTFADAGGGSYDKLGETNITSSTASVTFDGLYSSTYPNYKVIITDLLCTSNGGQLYARAMISGSENSATEYYGAQNNVYGGSGGGSTDGSRDWGQNYWRLLNWGISSSGGHGSTFEITIPNPLYASGLPTMSSHHSVNQGNFTYIITGTGGFYYNSATATSGIKFYYNTGNIKYGNFYMYGIKD